MIGDGKWLIGVTPDMPAGQAARLALTSRFAFLADAISAAESPSADPEPVHQLRVAVRRTAAAIDVFGDRLSAKTAKRARKVLRQLRRAAGAAREADVLLETLRDWAIGRANVEKPGIHFLNGLVFSERRDAQEALGQAIDRCRRILDRRFDRLLGGARDGKTPLGIFASGEITRLMSLLDARLTAGPSSEPGRLHAVRVAGKQLRYAVELVADVISPAMRTDLYPVIERLQDLLGLENDSQQAVHRLDALIADLTAFRPIQLPAVRAGINAFRAFHRDRIANQQSDLAKWRDEWARVKLIPVAMPDQPQTSESTSDSSTSTN